jgi:hypothetical protein
MRCKSCGSGNGSEFPGELAIHFPGRKGLDRPHVLMFPELVVCLDCGFAEFTIPKVELSPLKSGADVLAQPKQPEPRKSAPNEDRQKKDIA